jgi:peptidoglycan hydrolase-like protein with peptidoglycan-binding domain
VVAALAAGSACAVPAVADAAPKNAVFGARTLKTGTKGRDVRVLQDFLTRAGVATAVDGRFGPGTSAKVRAWEQRRAGGADGSSTGAASSAGVRIDGRLTPREARLLRQEVEAAEKGAAPQQKAAETPAPAATAPGEQATIGPDGKAIAPASAPEAVKRIIAAGNEIHDMPYLYGGGHSAPPNKASGYDCSGSMSYAFQGAGLLKNALDSSGFAAWGDPGPGQWVTTYGNAGHSYMIVAGLRFDTSGRANAGSRWQTKQRSSAGYTERHPRGL